MVNAVLPDHIDPITAVFMGAAIGMWVCYLASILQAYSQTQGLHCRPECRKVTSSIGQTPKLNLNDESEVWETDVSIISNRDQVCGTMKQRLLKKKIDLLLLSQGHISFNGREKNADGWDKSFSLRYYGRVSSAQTLLSSFAEHARIISIFSGAKEGKTIQADLDLERNFSTTPCAARFVSVTTFSSDHLGTTRRAGEKAFFIHVDAGLICTGLLGLTLKPQAPGERMWSYATDEQYQPPTTSWKS